MNLLLVLGFWLCFQSGSSFFYILIDIHILSRPFSVCKRGPSAIFYDFCKSVLLLSHSRVFMQTCPLWILPIPPYVSPQSSFPWFTYIILYSHCKFIKPFIWYFFYYRPKLSETVLSFLHQHLQAQPLFSFMNPLLESYSTNISFHFDIISYLPHGFYWYIEQNCMYFKATFNLALDMSINIKFIFQCLIKCFNCSWCAPTFTKRHAVQVVIFTLFA